MVIRNVVWVTLGLNSLSWIIKKEKKKKKENFIHFIQPQFIDLTIFLLIWFTKILNSPTHSMHVHYLVEQLGKGVHSHICSSNLNNSQTYIFKSPRVEWTSLIAGNSKNHHHLIRWLM